MPTTYNGNAAGLAATDTVAISDPNDGELASAASNDTAPKKLADYIQFILGAAGFLGVARSWTALQTFTLGMLLRSSADANPVLETDQEPATYKLLWRIGGGTRKLRLYYKAGQGFTLSVNAFWTEGSALWTRDTATSSFRLRLSTDGSLHLQSQSSATWADGAWAYSAAGVFDTLTTHTIASLYGGAIVLDNDVSVTLGLSAVTAALSSFLSSSSNPAATAGQSNKLHASNIAKAWGSFNYGSLLTLDTPTTFTSGPTPGGEGFNVATVERKLIAGTDSIIRVRFATAVASGPYAVALLDSAGNPSEQSHIYAANKSTAGFDIYGIVTPIGGANAAKNFGTAGGGIIDFSVFAKQ